MARPRDLLTLTAAVMLSVGCQRHAETPADVIKGSPARAMLRDVPPEVVAFIAKKEGEMKSLAAKLGVVPDSDTLEYFRLAWQGRYREASRIYQDLRERGGKVESPRHDPDFRLPLWDPLVEVQMALDAYASDAGRFATALGRTIVDSIPSGSVYFGGTDPGRALPAAVMTSGPAGDSFVVLSQNQLVDGQFRRYLEAAFGGRIRTLTEDDSQRAFQEYLDDAQRRSYHDQSFPNQPRQLKAGEIVTVSNGLPRVHGQLAVMGVNAVLARILFDKIRSANFTSRSVCRLTGCIRISRHMA